MKNAVDFEGALIQGDSCTLAGISANPDDSPGVQDFDDSTKGRVTGFFKRTSFLDG